MEYYPRKIEEKLDKWMERDEIIIVKGPRQSGKTTLLMHLREKFGGEYVTLEDEDAFETFDKAPLKFVERYTGKGRFLYIDEAQYSANAGKNLKLIYDRFRPKIKLVITGSGSFDTKVQVGKYLVGRAVYMELLPLSFEEFILWKAKDLHKIYSEWRNGITKFITQGKGIDTEPAFQKEFTQLLEEYLIYGGFPAIVKERETSVKQELLKNLSRTYLERDVFFFFNIREMEKFRLLLSYLSLITGSILEFSSISSELHMDFRTVEGYLSILLQTYLIYLLYPFYTNKLNELKKSKKVYFIDTGLRNSIIGNFLPLSSRTDAGALYENFVLRELMDMGLEPRYWRTTHGSEVDFIININGKYIPVEVKARGKEESGFRSFIRNYRPERGIVFTNAEIGVKEINETKIAYVPHYFI